MLCPVAAVLSIPTKPSIRSFEQRIALLLQDLGWTQVQRVGGSGDQGVDLRGTHNDQRYIIQCKRYKDRVNPDKVRELAGTLHHEAADRALLVTTGRFSQQSYDWIAGKPIELWDGTELARQIQVADAAQRDPVLRKRARLQWQLLLAALLMVNALALIVALMY